MTTRWILWIEQRLCGLLRGHERIRRYACGRAWLECVKCLHATPGSEWVR